MTYSIEAIAPFAQSIGSIDPSYTQTLTPSIFGSVADDSDDTFVEIEASFEDFGHRSGVLAADFLLPDPSQIPAYMHMQIRAKDAAAFNADAGVTIQTLYMHTNGADGGFAFDQWSVSESYPGTQLGDLAAGLVAGPTWLPFYYLGIYTPVDTANPSASTWLPLNPDEAGYVGGQALDALTNGGLRFVIYVDIASNLEPLHAYLDIYEVRLVLAYASRSGIPPLRHMQRSDGELMSTAPRAFQLNSVQGSLRNLSYL